MHTEHKVTEYDMTTGQITERPMTQSEQDIWRIEVQLEQQRKQEIETIHLAKESAKAKLAALGLTEDEVNAIIGGI